MSFQAMAWDIKKMPGFDDWNEDFCAYCGDGFKNEWDRHSDHMVPRSRGGSDRRHNRVYACRSCNSSKSRKTIPEFRLFRRLKDRDMDFTFFLEGAAVERDWMLLYSDKTIGRLVKVNFPYDEVA